MSQIECGRLTKVESPVAVGGVEFRGQIVLGSRIDKYVFLIAKRPYDQNGNPVDRNGNSPTHDVCVKRETGNYQVIGAAWTKASEKVEGGGFLSITLDDPDWPAPLNLSAFPPRRGIEWRVVWQRPRGERIQDQAA